MTPKNKKVSRDNIHASILNRATRLYKSGSKVFDESYLKRNEENVLKEGKFVGLSRDDIEEVLQVRPKVKKPADRDLLKQVTQEVERLVEEGAKITYRYDKADQDRVRRTAAYAEEYLKHYRRMLEMLTSIWTPYLERDTPDWYTDIINWTIVGMGSLSRLADMLSPNTATTLRRLRNHLREG